MASTAFNTLLCSPKFTLFSSNQNLHSFSTNLSFNINNLEKRNPVLHLQPPSVASVPVPPSNDEAYMQAEFGGCGVTFGTIGNIDGERCTVIKMRLDNGTMATLMLPSGLITSFKVPLWHGELLEMLHTQVSEGDNGEGAVIRGGVSLDLSFKTDAGFWSPSKWRLLDVRGSSDTSIQIELVGYDSKDAGVGIRYILSLQEETLSSELVVSNSTSSQLQFLGSFVSHLTVSTPDATYALGLEGSDFVDRSPLVSKYSFLPPDCIEQQLTEVDLNKPWAVNGYQTTNGGQASSEERRKGEEDDTYKRLTEKMCRIYTYAPSGFTVIDRGRRNSLIVGRQGFNELFLFSPGSEHDFYGKYAYICVGQSALLKPVTVGSEETWQGAQSLHNPSM